MSRADEAVVAELGVQRAGLRVEREQLGVGGADDDERRRLRVAREILDPSRGRIAAGQLVDPDFLARRRIQRNDAAVGRRDIHEAADDQRRAFRAVEACGRAAAAASAALRRRHGFAVYIDLTATARRRRGSGTASGFAATARRRCLGAAASGFAATARRGCLGTASTGPAAACRTSRRHVALGLQVIDPGNLQGADVGGRDLLQGREPHPARIMSIGGPFGRRGITRRRDRGGRFLRVGQAYGHHAGGGGDVQQSLQEIHWGLPGSTRNLTYST